MTIYDFWHIAARVVKMSNFTYEIFNEGDIPARRRSGADTTTQVLLMVQPKAKMAARQFKKMTQRYSNFRDNSHADGSWWGWVPGGGPEWVGYLYFQVAAGFEVEVWDRDTPEYDDGVGEMSRETAVAMFGEDSVLRTEQDVRAIWQWKNCVTKKGGIPYIKLVPAGFMEILRGEWNIGLQEISRRKAVELVGAEVTADCEQLCRDLYVAAPLKWLRDTTFGSYPLPRSGGRKDW